MDRFPIVKGLLPDKKDLACRAGRQLDIKNVVGRPRHGCVLPAVGTNCFLQLGQRYPFGIMAMHGLIRKAFRPRPLDGLFNRKAQVKA
ncbi:hypothetical protein [Bradyrhizobium sp. USDA 4506]